MNTNAKILRRDTLKLFREEFTSTIVFYTIVATFLFWLVNHYDFYPNIGNYLVALLCISCLALKGYQEYRVNDARSAIMNLGYSFKSFSEVPVLSQKEEFDYYQKIFKAIDYVFMDFKITPKESAPNNYGGLCKVIPKRLTELSEETKWFFIEKVSRLKYDIPLSVIISSFINKISLEDLLKIKELYLDKRTGSLLIEEIVDLILRLDSSTNNNKEKLELEIFSLYKKELPDFLDLINSNEKLDKRILNKLMLETNLVASDKNINKVVKI